MSPAAARLLVAAAAILPFLPSLRNGFVGWDDLAFVVDNPLIASPANLPAMLRSSLGGVWIPLSWLSLSVDRAVWGEGPFGFHLTSLLFHAAAALLFHECARLLMPKRPWAAVIAAAVFAAHPLRVETVAWAAERKGVLSGALALAACWAHLKDRPRAALAAFALSLAAKPNGAALPLALLSLDVLWLERKPSRGFYAAAFALSAAAVAATVLAGRGGPPPNAVTPLWTAGKAAFGLLFYPWKTLWPAGLSAYYPPRAWFFSVPAVAAAWTAVAAAAFAARRSKAAWAAAAFYAAALLPMLGLAAHGVPHAAADRFSYLPCVALAVLIGAALDRGPALRALALAWIAALGAASWARCAAWKDPLSLWSAAAEAEPGPYADANLGALLVKDGRTEEGIARLRAAIAAEPRHVLAHEALGAALWNSGRKDEAEAAWRAGMESAPSKRTGELLAMALVNRGNVLGRAGKLREAAALYREALEKDRASFEARSNLDAVERALRR